MVCLTNIAHHQAPADTRTKLTNLDRESACRLQLSTPTIAILHYSVRKLIFILLSHEWMKEWKCMEF